MNQVRKIRKVYKSKPTLEGAGVALKRAFGFREPQQFDPFLLLDDFRSDNPSDYLEGFPFHPHRGIETITYMLKGTIEHQDSLGNQGVIGPGDVQWMTAGSGIIHQEMPKPDPQGSMHGFQLWANLPARYKMMPPRYQEIKADQIPTLQADGGVLIRLICGSVAGVQGPVSQVMIAPQYLDVTVPPETEYIHPTPLGHTVFAYVIAGLGAFCQQEDPFSYEMEGANYFDTQRSGVLSNESLVLFEDGDAVRVRASSEGARFLLISGKPIGEPVAWYGPIVMNTQTELRLAFDELQAGTFIKHP
ncbi:MAG: pirin family protein [Anaerolineales bacterium]|nr:pirin family protein [Anaerolineales bacterium]